MEEKKIGTGIGIMILKNGKILLGKRHEDPEKADSILKGAGTWTMPGGKLHFGESFEKGAIREVEEETGIILNKTEVICINNDQVEDAHFITTGLLAETDQEPKVLEPDEITEWKWFPLDNLPSPIYFPSAKLLENYKNKQFYIKEEPKLNWKDKCWVTTMYLVKEDGKVLLTFNKNLNTWIPVGGHIEPGETPEQAIIREMEEETGFDFDFFHASHYENNGELKIIKPYKIQIEKVPHHNHHMNFVFIGKCKKHNEKETTDENEKLKWFSEQELVENKEQFLESVWKDSLKAIKLLNNREE